jgi:hypothetical protein
VTWRPEDLAVVVPMLGRPHRVAPLLESLDATAPGCRVMFVLTLGDQAVAAEVDRHSRPRAMVRPKPQADYATKINAGVRVTDAPLVFTGADDLRFHAGWFEAATAKLAPGVGVVGTNDLGSPRVQAGDHATHMLLTRQYIDEHGTADERGKVYHEGYWHEWVDDEAVATAKSRGAWAMALDSHVEHLHPDWGKAPPDGLYLARRRARMDQGRALFRTRQRLWT